MKKEGGARVFISAVILSNGEPSMALSNAIGQLLKFLGEAVGGYPFQRSILFLLACVVPTGRKTAARANVPESARRPIPRMALS